VINEAAEAEGFLITRGAEDMGTIRTTSPIPGFPDHVFHGRNDTVNITLYPYARYHTLAFIMECGFEESLIVRAKRALQVGQERWRFSLYEAYPVNQVGLWTLAAISAWGTNATQRRESRCELWQKLPQLNYGLSGPYPARDSLVGYLSTTPEGREQVWWKDNSEVLENLRANPRFDANAVEAIEAVLNRTPVERFAGDRHKPRIENPDRVEPIQNGVVFRLLIPYDDAEVKQVLLDGHPVERSCTDGYDVRHGPGTIVEFAIPPGKVEGFHIFSCIYDTPTKRRAGFTPEDW
jgi:hypothetical protein